MLHKEPETTKKRWQQEKCLPREEHSRRFTQDKMVNHENNIRVTSYKMNRLPL